MMPSEIRREVYSRPKMEFRLLQHSLLPLGYKLTESSRDRVGKVVAASVRRFWKKIQAITDGKRRKRMKGETWIKVDIKPDEVQCTPNDITAETLRKRGGDGGPLQKRVSRCWQEAAKQTFIANTVS